jgi:hypothetical protein
MVHTSVRLVLMLGFLAFPWGSHAQELGPYRVTEVLGGRIVCDGKDHSMGFGFFLEAGVDSFLVGSSHSWDADTAAPQVWNILGQAEVYDATTFAPIPNSRLSNSLSPCDVGKGYGYAGTFVGDLNKDGIEDLALGVPYTKSPEVHVMESTGHAGFHNRKTLTSELAPPFESIQTTDWFGRSVKHIPGRGRGKLLVTAPRFLGGSAYVYSLDSNELLFQSEPSNSQIPDRNGYDAHLAPDLDQDGEIDFMLLPSYQDESRAAMNVPGKVHFYSSRDGRRLLSLVAEAGNCRAATAAEFVDDLDGDGFQELVLGFAYCDSKDLDGSNLHYAGRIVILKGSVVFSHLRSQVPGEVTLSETMILSQMRGRQAIALLGGDVHNWVDLNGDGIREFFVSEMGYSPKPTMRNAGRALVMDGKTQKILPAYEITGSNPYEFFPARIAVIPGLRTFAMSSPFANQGQGVVRFYKLNQ